MTPKKAWEWGTFIIAIFLLLAWEWSKGDNPQKTINLAQNAFAQTRDCEPGSKIRDDNHRWIDCPVQAKPTCSPLNWTDNGDGSSTLEYDCPVQENELRATLLAKWQNERDSGNPNTTIRATPTKTLAKISGLDGGSVLGRASCQSHCSSPTITISRAKLIALTKASASSASKSKYSKDEQRMRDFWWEYTGAYLQGLKAARKQMPNCCATMAESETMTKLENQMVEKYDTKVLNKYGITRAKAEGDIGTRAAQGNWATQMLSAPRDQQESQ